MCNCTYGQHLLKNEEKVTKYVNCEGNFYNNKIINNEESFSDNMILKINY